MHRETAASGKERLPRSDNGSHNIFIEGDNLEALKLLYKLYFGRVKMIYIDLQGRYLELTGQQDAEGNLLTSNPETSRPTTQPG